MVADQDGPLSALHAFRFPNDVKRYPFGHESIGARETIGNYNKDPSSLFRGHIAYPEPWLYLRTGSRFARWPFRAKFIELGAWQWRMGPAQTALRYGIAICVALLMASLIVAERGRRPLKVPRVAAAN